ncbi:hypothetical protein G9A89_010016 [Geosiphon pyriformis]|nr:hypothetical protein G9A89_010016 [Geosiphon pyriformis]
MAENNIIAKGCFEFTLNDISKVEGKIYSPIFSTAADILWQLVFKPCSTADPEFCSMYLYAIPNSREQYSTGIWEERNPYIAELFLKDASEPIVIIKQKTLELKDKYSLGERSVRGYSRFFKNADLPHDVIIGVTLNQVEFKHTITRPTQNPPSELINAWASSLDQIEVADVKISVKEKSIFCNSYILRNRSDYFRAIFEGEWAESNNVMIDRHGTIENSSSRESSADSPTDSQFKAVIEIQDFDHDTVLAMLQFFYTDQIGFEVNKPQKSPIALFAIADKYLVKDLRQRAKAKLCKDLNINTAAEFLFREAWKWDDLKTHTMNYVQENFEDVRGTPGYENIMKNLAFYPQASELLAELLAKLVPPKKSDSAAKKRKSTTLGLSAEIF